MKCDICGYDIEKNWKYCPNCRNKISQKKSIKFIIIILLIIFICLLSRNNNQIDDNYIKIHLENKYNEQFDKVWFIRSDENPDVNLNCDGSSFGTIKKDGSTEYYKIYSKENNLEFFAYYDTSDKGQVINDTYDSLLNRRETAKETYEILYNYLNENISKISVLYNSNDYPIEIYSKDELNDILSEFDDEDIIYNFESDFYVYINDNIYEFSKNNFNTLKNLNSKIISLKENKQHYFSVELIFNNSAKLELDRLNGEVYIYDMYGNDKAWGERLDDFVKRENY